MEQEQKSILNIPVAILIAGTLIAGSVLWNKYAGGHPIQQKATDPAASEGVLAPVTANDHILGNPDAQVVIVEYSDTSCPFCKMFHPTMRKIMDDYGKTGQVAWVYRHFPLDKPNSLGEVLHKNSGNEAEASECAASIGGNTKFWDFINKLYAVTPSVTADTPEGLDQNQLPVIAQSVGIDKNKFIDCLASGQFKDKVEAEYVDGLNAGVVGTPFSFILTKDGGRIPLNGAQPYAAVKAAIEGILKKN